MKKTLILVCAALLAVFKNRLPKDQGLHGQQAAHDTGAYGLAYGQTESCADHSTYADRCGFANG